MATAPASAKDGTLRLDGQIVADVRSINFQVLNEVKKYASSSTAGWKRAVKGQSDWKVSFEVYLPDGSPVLTVEVGDTVAIVGVTTTGSSITGSIMIASIGMPVPIEGGDLMVASIDAEGIGEPTLA